MPYQLKVEKTISKPANEVFNALKGGALFMNCGAESSAQIDFRVGGKYNLNFKNHGVKNFGEFLEIVPDKKIVFTWCQTFAADQKPDTQVTIELFADGPKTRVMIQHTGFKDQEGCTDHERGWSIGLNDFADEIENGRLRMVRTYDAPVEKLFETCKNPESFFAFMGDLSRGTVDFRVGGKYQVPTATGEVRGEFLEIVPNKKITISWLAGCGHPLKDSQVTLNFNQKENGSSLELLHSGLPTEKDQMSHRKGWEVVTSKMTEAMAHISNPK